MMLILNIYIVEGTVVLGLLEIAIQIVLIPILMYVLNKYTTINLD